MNGTNAGGGDQLADTVLTIDPVTGAIGADFAGHVTAAGVDLTAKIETLSPLGANKLRWLHPTLTDAGVPRELGSFWSGYGGPTGASDSAALHARVQDQAALPTTVDRILLRQVGGVVSSDWMLTELGVNPDIVTTPYWCRLVQSGASLTALIAAGNTTLAWDNETDPRGMHDPAVNPSRITIVLAGTYLVVARISVGVLAQLGAFVLKNGGSTTEGSVAAAPLTAWGAFQTSTVQLFGILPSLVAGDFLELQGRSTVAANTTASGSIFGALRISP